MKILPDILVTVSFCSSDHFSYPIDYFKPPSVRQNVGKYYPYSYRTKKHMHKLSIIG